jgi:hypothetical protein
MDTVLNGQVEFSINITIFGSTCGLAGELVRIAEVPPSYEIGAWSTQMIAKVDV